ncbi:hypothetical protein K4F52_010011 [Lecanicillium sp. MT-2017a]|nr:hypothetical protein K4F52_010011 [Lecanicillium sp. MT-2017a]
MSFSNADTGNKPADTYTEKNKEDVDMRQKVEDLVNFITECKFGMMTTKSAETGRLVSRCMALAGTEHGGADLVFQTNTESGKTDDIASDPAANMSFLNSHGDWASISGRVATHTDRETIKKYYSAQLRAWVGDLGDGVHDGSVDDPRIGVIKLVPETATYALADKGGLRQTVEVAKSTVTGSVASVNRLRHISESEYTAWRVHHPEKKLLMPDRAKRFPQDEGANPDNTWVAPAVASQAVIVDLVDLYFEIVYPIFPFFHQPSFTRRISRADYTTDRPLFAATMAVYIGIIEREERRRLFWSIYTLDIFTSVVWGGIIRCREKQSKVAYPTEADDELITNNAISQPAVDHQGISPTSLRRSSRVSADCWLSGWNFITDLYRVLEHALTRFRGHNSPARRYSFLDGIFSGESNIAETSIGDSVLQMYFDLPQCFKETPDMTFDTKRDRFGFQAANITGSLQLVRIVLLASGGAAIDARCQIAREVVDAFMSIPATYLLAISTPLLHHLGGIGAVLGSVFGEPGTDTEYRAVQSIILSMAQLLENLEPIHQCSSASQSLRDNAAIIDAYIESKRIPPSSGVDITNTNGSSSLPRQADNATEYPYALGLSDTAESLPTLVQSDLLDQLAWGFNFSQTWD